MILCMLQIPYDSSNLDSRLAEIEQQTKMQSGGFEIVHALRDMNVVERADRLQFDENQMLDQKVGNVLADENALVPHGNGMLLCDDETIAAKLLGQRVFIDFLDESRA